MSKENGQRIPRRDVLKATSAGALAVGGFGTVAADHGEQGGNRRGGDDHGQGKSPGRDDNNRGGQGGGGGTTPTGGSALLQYPVGTTSPTVSVGDEFAIVNNDTGDRINWYPGCDSVGVPAKPQTYRGIEVSWAVGSGPTTIYVVANRPVLETEEAIYAIVEDPEDCGSSTEAPDHPNRDYSEGQYFRTGWEPGNEDEDHDH